MHVHDINKLCLYLIYHYQYSMWSNETPHKVSKYLVPSVDTNQVHISACCSEKSAQHLHRGQPLLIWSHCSIWRCTVLLVLENHFLHMSGNTLTRVLKAIQTSDFPGLKQKLGYITFDDKNKSVVNYLFPRWLISHHWNQTEIQSLVCCCQH